MLKLIKGAHVYSPRDMGVCDVLVSGSKILKIDRNIELELPDDLLNVYNAEGRLLVPGFVDSLVHISGGGGEGGFHTRTPMLKRDDAIRAGVTSLVGVLGTDATTRNLGELYGKARALSAEGLNCYMHTGSYEFPVQTISGSVRGDLLYIDNVIGVGEIAIADHRGSQLTVAELARVAADARVGGLLSGKAGIVSVHVGDGATHLQLLTDIVEQTDIPAAQFYPTHMSRSAGLLEAGVAFTALGGTIDFTTSTTAEILAQGEIKASKALVQALEKGAPLSQVTFSSDAQGSLPNFDSEGKLKGLKLGKIESLWEEVRDAILAEGLAPEAALEVITINPARILGLKDKGRLEANSDADLNLIDPSSLQIECVMSRGEWLMKEGDIVAKTVFDD